jgi:predicted RNase H-like HicB family nuclease
MPRTKTYTIVIERAKRNLSAYVPDLPGCVATGPTVAGVTRNMRKAIEFHLQGLAEDGLPIPEPTTTTRQVQARLKVA